jgi:hypothetical protein
MVKHPVMYAIAYKYEEEVWVNFKDAEDTDSLSFECLLPSENLAKEYIEDVLTEDYMVIPVTVVSYREGTTHFEYAGPKEWI